MDDYCAVASATWLHNPAFRNFAQRIATKQNTRSVLSRDMEMASSREFGGYASFLVAQPYIAVLLSAVLFGCFVVQTLLPKRTIYDQFDRVGNPGWLPKFLGKDATAMLYEGYERVSLPACGPHMGDQC